MKHSYKAGDVVIVKSKDKYITSSTTCDIIDRDGVLYAKAQDSGIALKLHELYDKNTVELAHQAVA